MQRSCPRPEAPNGGRPSIVQVSQTFRIAQVRGSCVYRYKNCKWQKRERERERGKKEVILATAKGCDDLELCLFGQGTPAIAGASLASASLRPGSHSGDYKVGHKVPRQELYSYAYRLVI